MRSEPKPSWIKVRPPAGPSFNRITSLLRERKLHTVCEEAHCPNVAECWGEGTATLMLLGEICTRGCRFCVMTSGNPGGIVDPAEPRKTAETVEIMGLTYVVLTSVDRDDLPDGGAGHFARTVRTIRERCPGVLIETLIPDFAGDRTALKAILEARPEVLGHNVETVRRLTPLVRDVRAGYDQSVQLLKTAKDISPGTLTKSSIMLGLGETEEELKETFADLKAVGVDFLTMGQYLRPSLKHLPVTAFLSPRRFGELRELALSYGFRYVVAAPLARSSYKAGEYFTEAFLRNRRADAPAETSGARPA
ncbi:MAG: lipoyl synthase [Pseudomonadota bacterium]